MPLLTDAHHLVGYTIREITHDAHGWHIIVDCPDDEIKELSVWEIYPFLTHDGPNTRVEMHAECIA
jgi:hypothetical protein